MENPFAYIADPLGIHWGWVAVAAWVILYLIVRNFIGWLAIGFLAIGSIDANRFHPGMSIDFLTRLGDLVVGALKRY